MKKKAARIVLAVLTASIVLLSCPSPVSRGEGSGVVTVRLESPSYRGLLDAPPIPVFSSAVVTITGSGMSPVSANLVNGSASVEVPAGGARVITVDAVPDWDATIAQYPGVPLPIIAVRYGGASVMDVEGGKTVGTVVHLAVTGTRIVLPSSSGDAMYVADSFAGIMNAQLFNYGSGLVGAESDYEPDQYGRLFLTTEFAAAGGEPAVICQNSMDAELLENTAGKPICRIAPDVATGRLYFAGNDESSGELGYYGQAAEYTNFNQPTNLSGNWNPYNSATALYPRIAVDREGYVYVVVYSVDENKNYIAKLSVGSSYYSAEQESNVADLTVHAKTTYEAVGLIYTYPSPGNLLVDDMVVIGDTLYLLGNGFDETSTRGKIVALRTSDLGDPREAGWCGDANTMPVDPNSQFYGPARFIGFAEGKLYVADEGYDGNPVDRVVEVSLEPFMVSDTSDVPGGVTFFWQ